MSDIYDTLLKTKQETPFVVATVTTVSPLTVKILPTDDAINCKAITSLTNIAIGSRVLMIKYLNQYIAISVIGDIEDFSDYATITDLDDYVATDDVEWTSWNPTLNWTGTTPSGLTTIAKYCHVGNLLHFAIDIITTDGNDATNLTINAPVNEAADNMHTLFTAVQIVNGSYNYNVPCWINNALGTHKIEFRNLNTFTNGVTSYLFLSGTYETV